MGHSALKTKRTLALALIATALTGTVLGQKPDAAAGAAVASEPGRAAIVRAAEISAQVVSIDRATRTVTLKGPQENILDVVAGAEVKNFDQIRLGDFVVARYVEALTLELRKTKAGAGDVTVSEEAARAEPGERPSVAGARQVTAIADIIAVNPKKSTITLKGPKGNVVTLNVQNPDQFRVVKKAPGVRIVVASPEESFR
jgi:hypothetical protein